MYAAADFILRPMILAFLLLTAAALGLAWHGAFSRPGGHARPRRALTWDEDDRGTVVLAAPGEREETLVSAGHSAYWEPNVTLALAAPVPALASVTVTDDPGGRHAQPRVHAFKSGGEPYCSKCGTAGHWRGDESCADVVVTELVTRHRDGKVGAAIAEHLAAEGFRYHATTDAAVDSIVMRAVRG